MQAQLLLQVGREKEKESILQGTAKALREATSEVSSISSIVYAQGEAIQRIEQKIFSAESTLRRASRNLTKLIRKSKKRKALSVCLLVFVTVCTISLFVSAIRR